jgi:transposase InsO family protein
MPWTTTTIMDERTTFIKAALSNDANIRSLCREYEISSATAYKWLTRYREGGASALADRSRRPQRSLHSSATAQVEAIVSMRAEHPAWGARKIAACLQRQGITPPAASTITRILHRHGLITMTESQKHHAWKRFVHEKPNDLWQMDFKGDVALDHGRCHPLTVLDDHSRFNLGLVACANEQTVTVRSALTAIFRSYGLPVRMTMDNGSPWGNTKENPYTALTVWLMRLGIRISHSRPYHPQTQGKDERFHRTLKAEVLSRTALTTLHDAQQQFDRWRSIYNTERPHEALGMDVPAQHYQASLQTFPEHLTSIDYPDGAFVRSVQLDGAFSLSGRTAYVSKAFAGWKIAIIETDNDGLFDVYFCQNKISTLNFNELPRTE